MARVLAVLSVAASLACATTPSRSDLEAAEQAPARSVPNVSRSTVPVELARGLPIIEAKIDGVERPVRLLVDTGAPTTIRPSIASQAEAVIDPDQARSTFSDNYGNLVEGDSIVLYGVSIGGVRMESVPAVVIESEIFSRFCPPIDGILGTAGYSRSPGALERAFWELDFVEKELMVTLEWDRSSGSDVVFPARTWQLSRAGRKLAGSSVLVPVRIDGHVAWAVFDTGGSGVSKMSIGFFERIVGSLDELERFEYVGYHAGTIAEPSPSVRSWIVYPREVGLGGLKLSSVPFRVVEMDRADSIEVTLQAELLTLFDVAIDLRRDEVRLSLRPDTEGSGRLRTQLRFLRAGDRIFVAGMLKDGSAARAGIRLGDQLIRLRGEDVNAADKGSVCAATLWNSGGEGEVEMTLQRGGSAYSVTLGVFEDDLRANGSEP